MNTNLRKFLNFYKITLDKVENEHKYYASIDHNFFPKDITIWKRLKFLCNGIENFHEDTSIHSINLVLKFIPEVKYIMLPPKVEVHSWTTSDIPDNVEQGEKISLQTYKFTLEDYGNYLNMSRKVMDNRKEKEEDDCIEVMKGDFVYPDLAKIYGRINRTIINNVGINLDQDLFVKLLDEGTIFGRELFLSQLKKNLNIGKEKNNVS